MELVAVLAIAHKEHIADKSIESIAQVGVSLVGLALEGGFHLALGVVGGFHLPDIVVGMIQEGVLDILGTLAKDAVEGPVGNEWLSEVLFLEMQAVGLYLFACHS